MTEKGFALTTAAATMATYAVLSALAYAQRGYVAFGGEVVVLFILPLCAYIVRSETR